MRHRKIAVHDHSRPCSRADSTVKISERAALAGSGPKLPKLARKYRPLVSPLREFVLRPDTPLDSDVKDTITRQLDSAAARLAAILG